MPEPLARETDPAVVPEREARRRAVERIAAGAPLLALTPDAAAPDALRSAVPRDGVVTAFETLERLDDFAETLEALIELSAERAATVVVAVPNHAVAAPQEGARTAWDAGALAELRSLLPDEHVVVPQVALRGAAVPAAGAQTVTVEIDIDPAAVPVAWLVAFGPRAGELGASAVVAQADATAERAARAALESELELLRARVAALEARAA